MSVAQVSAPPARWPWVLLVVFALAAIAGLPLSAVNGTGVVDEVPFVVAFGAFGLVGALIASRDRRNRIGSLFLWASVIAGAGSVSSEVVTVLFDRGIRGGVGLAVAAVMGEAAWIVGLLPALILLPLLFPDGRLPSRRWRPVLWSTFATLLVVFVAFILGSPTLAGSAERVQAPNPFFVASLTSASEFVEDLFSWVFLGILAASVGSLVLRFRRSRGVERQQIKWFALAVVFLLAVITATEVLLLFGIENLLLDMLLVAPAFLFLPVSVGVAVLRYRLYDLDVVVRKTVLYGLLVAVATAVYVVVVIGVGTVVGRDSPFLTMVAAVVLALGFQPARTRLAHVANRIVYGRPARHALRGPDRVLRTRRRRLRGRGRPSADGADPRRGHGCRGRARLAPAAPRAATGRRVAVGLRGPGAAAARGRRGRADRRRDGDRGPRPRRAPRRSLGPDAGFGSDRAPRRSGSSGTSPPRPVWSCGTCDWSRTCGPRVSGWWRRRTRSGGGWSATSTTAPSSSSLPWLSKHGSPGS